MFSGVAEHPLIGSTRMSQDVLIFEVREAEVRSRLKESKPGRLSQGGGRELSAGSPRLARCCFSEMAVGKEVRIGSSERCLSRKL